MATSAARVQPLRGAFFAAAKAAHHTCLNALDWCFGSADNTLMLLRTLLASAVLLIGAHAGGAAPYAELQAKRPDLFDPKSGYRIARQRAPTPDDIPAPVRLVETAQIPHLLAQGALPLDVFGAAQSRYDEIDGTWLVSEPRLSLPGAVWLPETGRGVLSDAMQAYLADNLDTLTNHNKDHPILVFCIADCWMSWNAAQRIAAMGYTNVGWFRLGTDGWQDMGWPLFPVAPVPVNTD